MSKTEFAVISKVIPKNGDHLPEDNLYHIAIQHCLEGLFVELRRVHAQEQITHVVFEQRGTNEDKQLELEFRRICSGDNFHQQSYPFVPIFASKKANSSGLQFADLIARPIGLAHLKPEQPNRAFEILKNKKFNLPLKQSEFTLEP